MATLRYYDDGVANYGHVLLAHGSDVFLRLLHVFQCRLHVVTLGTAYSVR